MVSPPGVQRRPCSFPYLYWVYTQLPVFLRTYYVPDTVLGAKLKSPQTHRTGGSHPLVLMTNTPYKGLFLFCPAKEKTVQLQSG